MRPSTVMHLLQDGVPLTLLLDLSDTERMSSRAILRHEPADLTWLNAPNTPSQNRPAKSSSN